MSQLQIPKTFIGMPRNTLRAEPVIQKLCFDNPRFAYWFENKFLKWEYDAIYEDDLDNINDAVRKAVREVGSYFL